jgi:hypothetical protein
MDTESNNPLRIAIGTGLIVVGGIVGGPAMARMLQPEPMPCWALILLILGGVTIVSGLLILIVPPRRWGSLWHSVLELPKWLHSTCYWECHGPRCTIGNPIFKPSEISEIGHDDYEAKISASIMVWIKTGDKPLRINLSSANVCLEQKVGWDERKTRFQLNTQQVIPEIILEPHVVWCDQILVNKMCHGKRESFPDIQKRHRWGVRGISVALPKGNVKQLHKGAHCKPTHNEIRV